SSASSSATFPRGSRMTRHHNGMPLGEERRAADVDPMDEKREKGIRDMLIGIGENPDREGLLNTPTRVIRAWREICSGYKADPAKLVTPFDGENYDEMISVGPISFYSTCEHHLLPFF